MKKIRLFILSLFTIFLVGNYTQANNEYEYTNLDITANILIDGTIDVKEDITADFFIQKHGIIRDIPLNYTVLGQDFHIEVSNINVQGKNFTTNQNGGNVEIKIGDADRTLIGKQDYPISYSTYGLIRNFSGMGYAELYWNLVGDDFDTNINKVRAELILPKDYTGFTAEDFLITTDGKSKTIDGFDGTIDWSKGDKIIITYDKGLTTYQAITLAIKFPNDYFVFDHTKQAKLLGHVKISIWDRLEMLFYTAMMPIAIISLLIYSIIKKFQNRKSRTDTKSWALKGEFAKQFPVIVQYEPPKGLNSAEVGLLLHREARAKDMISLIYKWATEGLIKLAVEEEESFFGNKKVVTITRLGSVNDGMSGYEQDFFRALTHDVKTKIIKSENLHNRLGLSELEHYGKNKGRLTRNRIHKGHIRTLLVGLYFFMQIFNGVSLAFVLIVIISCLFIVISLSGKSKRKETEEGAKLISHILGYREFIRACDENKLRLFLQQDPLYFDKILPYAIVFGLETELLKKIEPILQEMDVKSSRYDGDFHSIYTINDTFSSVATSSSTPKISYNSSGGFGGGSSFGGGFSSGGGGGGGGGRSW